MSPLQKKLTDIHACTMLHVLSGTPLKFTPGPGLRSFIWLLWMDINHECGYNQNMSLRQKP